ncbi:MAG: TIGR02221 family CRISPR-associated protein [Bacteroidales bacterium]|nr:TIGR02221 family CRISPR-associated protein [Bacteroidales bacterium]
MPRKVFISFLGANNYRACHYCKDDYKSAEVRYVQEATLEYLTRQEEWGADSLALILLTAGAEAKNWEDNGHRDRDTNEVIEQTGLRVQLERMALPFEVRPVRGLPDGNNEQEIWTIFSRIFDELDEGDELYFDLTHGFRYLPMLALVLGNYAKFLKHATVRHISYGNFEERNRTTNEAPFIDLLPLTQLQDWTFAASTFEATGRMTAVSEALEAFRKSYTPKNKAERKAIENLQKVKGAIPLFEKSISTCRGNELVEGATIAQIRENMEGTLSLDIPYPLKEIVRHIEEPLKVYSVDSLDNLREAIAWCLKNGLVQQAYTLAQETIITVVCDKLKDFNTFTGDKSYRKYRDYIGAVLGMDIKDARDESKWNGYAGHHFQLTKALFQLEWVKELRKSYETIKNNRNQINHAGFTGKVKSDDLINNLQQKINAGLNIVFGTLELPIVEKYAPHFVNLTNHPLEAWSEEQLAAASAYGEAVDYSFPAVSPDDTEEDIVAMANEIVADITARYGTECTVHLMGEFTMTAALLQRFQQRGIACVASTTERIVSETEPRKKVVEFKFVKFRKY